MFDRENPYGMDSHNRAQENKGAAMNSGGQDEIGGKGERTGCK
jgi:hypothetical protein